MRLAVFARWQVFTLVLLAAALVGCQQTKPAADVAAGTDKDKEIEALKAEVQTLKDKAVSASVAMADVSFHWSNLWFAGEAKNWPLAAYYYSESRNHVRWLIRINPMPKGPDGELVDLKGIFDALDTTTFAAVKTAIDKKDSAGFETAYRTALESCYQCHKSVGRAYLRLQVPKVAPQTIVNLDPNATWPK
jgi:hypothetical protein